VLIPYILGILAVILGAASIYSIKKKQGKIAVMGVLGVLIALAAMPVNYFYMFIF
jgi:hypothetical protein